MRDGEILALVYFVVVGVAALALLAAPGRCADGRWLVVPSGVACQLATATPRAPPSCATGGCWSRCRWRIGRLAPLTGDGQRADSSAGCSPIDDRLGLTRLEPAGARPAGVRLSAGLSDGAGGTARRQPSAAPAIGGGLLARAPGGRAAVLRAAAAAARRGRPAPFCCPTTPTVGTTSTLVRRANVQFLADVRQQVEHAAERPRGRRGGGRRDGVAKRLAAGARLRDTGPRHRAREQCAGGTTTSVDTVSGVMLGIAAALLLP